MPIIWIMGMPCSGKSSIAIRLEKLLLDCGIEAKTLDGDEVRHKHGRYDFSREGRIKHIQKVLEEAKELSSVGHVVICSFITPYKEMRKEFGDIDDFIEVYLKCPKDVCRHRDVKGLWKRADDRALFNFTGVDDVFEEPDNPDIIVDTSRYDIQQTSIFILLKFISMMKKRFFNEV